MNERITEQDEFLLSQLLDGDLSGAEAAQLRERLEREPALKAAFAAYQQIDQRLQAQRSDVPNVDYDTFHAEVMANVEADREAAEAETLKFPVWLKWSIPISAAAAIGLIVMAGWGMFNPNANHPKSTMPFAQNTGDHDTTGETAIAQAPKKDDSLPPAITPDEGTIAMAAVTPSAMIVRYSRPDLNNALEPTDIDVKFGQSQTLAKQIQEKDEARRNRPSYATAKTMISMRAAPQVLYDPSSL